MKKRISPAQSGVSPAAQPFNPADLQEEAAPGKPETRSAPAPGVPVSAEEYAKMKDRAARRTAPRKNNAQEDQNRK